MADCGDENFIAFETIPDNVNAGTEADQLFTNPSTKVVHWSTHLGMFPKHFNTRPNDSYGAAGCIGINGLNKS